MAGLTRRSSDWKAASILTREVRCLEVKYWRGFPTFYVAGGARSTVLLRRCAYHTDKILKGAKPGELPVEQPTKFDPVLNLKTAKALAIKIPESIMLGATEVIR